VSYELNVDGWTGLGRYKPFTDMIAIMRTKIDFLPGNLLERVDTY
jgi:hypothetical protein